MVSSALTTSKTPASSWYWLRSAVIDAISGLTGTTRNEVGSTAGLIVSIISGCSRKRSLKSSYASFLSTYSNRSTSGLSASLVSRASRWASWIFGSMKMMSSMPPSHCRVA